MNPVRDPGETHVSNGMKRILVIVVIVIALLLTGATVFLKSIYVIPVVMYHSIDDKSMETKLSVSPESFERQMKFLFDRHYNVVGLDKIVSYMEKKGPVSPKTIAITFDDGYYNNYQYAYPVLKRYGIPATIFVIVEKIGLPGWLGWKELKEMSDSGLITIASHTQSHSWLPSDDNEKLYKELLDSKNNLEKELGKKVDLLCYPLGAFDERVQRAAKDTGYECAVITNSRRPWPSDDIYAIKRIKISRTSDSLLVFWLETSGYYTWIKEIRDSR